MRTFARVVAVLTSASVVACASPENVMESSIASLVGRDDVVTQVNLHPRDAVGHDLHRHPRPGRLSTANLLGDGLISAGTPVRIEELSPRSLTFVVPETSRTYEYTYEDHGTEPFAEHLERVFGTSSPEAEIDRLPSLDRWGIEQGEALPGMTRRGVWFALGPPPHHANSGYGAERWIYCEDHIERIAVHFDAGSRVTAVRD